MNRITLGVLAIVIGSFSSAADAAEVIGPHVVRAPDSADVVSGELGGGWLNVVNAPVDIDTAFSGESIIDDGIANVGTGGIVEVVFDIPVVNIAGPDLVLYDARYDDGSYVVSTEFDGFAFDLGINQTSGFISTGLVYDYHFGGSSGNVFSATVYAAEIDLTDLGLPAGASVQRVQFRATNSGADPLGIGAIVPTPGTGAVLIGVGVGSVLRRTRGTSA